MKMSSVSVHFGLSIFMSRLLNKETNKKTTDKIDAVVVVEIEFVKHFSTIN